MNGIIKKFFTVILISILAALIAGIYGILHDQLTYTISPEYYTKFKFIQFNIYEDHFATRARVSTVGFLATWWFGLLLGIILSLFGLLHKDWKMMLKVSMKSILIALITAFIIGLMGLLYGQFILSKQPRSHFNSWYIPENIIDLKSYISVGSMHNFSYLGGIIGLILGVIYSYKISSLSKK
ncbi:hypothetical protein [Chryseobacterium gwangjuense]|uniref:hypothetical protein n=1 Tax=Chryseobacterium gwangjuense TaxID=1069980 RepID=UPI001E60F251|nr:hypothetical protein [Chryseobacterium gwangjuense]MCE3075566.1 hypothetical protein [Chryseobacterium gwangjuense]